MSDRGNWIQTHSGRQFFPLDPRPEDIDIRDIAHALSHLCRYGGHTHEFYSVAEHSELVSQGVQPKNAKWGLMHDAAEAYLVDVPRPIKQMLPLYQEIEMTLLYAIAQRFNLPMPARGQHLIPDEVRRADSRILLTERKVLLPNTVHPWDEIEHHEPLPVVVVGWPPAAARRRFLTRFHDLGIE